MKTKLRGVAVILHSDWNVWVRLRERSAMQNGLWEVCGGRVEEGEQPVEAALRELREEAGLTRRASDLRFITATQHTKQMQGREVHYETSWYSLMLRDDEVPCNTEPDKASGWLRLRAESCQHLQMMPGLQERIFALMDVK